MTNEFQTTWRLLKPHALPRLRLLVLVVVLGSISALQAVALALVEPVWNLVLFPPDAAPGAAPSAAPVAAARSATVDVVLGARDWLLAHGVFDRPEVAALAFVATVAVLLGVVTSAAQYGFTYLSRLISFRMIVDLRLRLARHLMGLSLRYHNERRFGDLLSRISSDVTTTLAAINTGLKGLVLEPLQALAYLLVALFAAPLPTLGLLVFVPVAAYPVSRLTRKVRRRSTKSLSTLGSSVQALSQMFQGIRTVKAFGGEQAEVERYRDLNESYLRTSMRMVRSIAMTHAWTMFLGTAGIGLLALALGLAHIRFDLFRDGGQMTTFFGAMLMLSSSVRNLTKAWTRVQESVGAGVRIRALLDEQVDVVEAPDPVRLERFEREVVFEEVSFRYPGGDRDAVHRLSLRVRRGETLALVGVSGAGKTTVVDLVARFIDPTEGRITVDGVDLREVAVADWTRQYALVGQVPFLFHASIAENIRYGAPEASDEDVRRAARAADIHDFVLSLPDGYETDVADMGQRLSGGQRQRITIARALLKGAPLLLLDEATSSLDSESEAEVQRALERLMAERTVIVIAHRLATIRRADRIAVLDAGRLVELGTHDELLRAGGTYARLHALQELPSPAPAR